MTHHPSSISQRKSSANLAEGPASASCWTWDAQTCKKEERETSGIRAYSRNWEFFSFEEKKYWELDSGRLIALMNGVSFFQFEAYLFKWHLGESKSFLKLL